MLGECNHKKLKKWQTIANILITSVNTTLHVYPGVPHAFMSLPTLPSAEKWRQEMQRDLKAWIDTK